MSLFYIKHLLFLLILQHYTLGLSQLPLCQCECCPGEQCRSNLLIFSVDKCNETTCSFEQCYQMYPKKCGLIPGITNSSCNHINETSTNLMNDISLSLPNTASSMIMLPIVIIINTLFVYLYRV